MIVMAFQSSPIFSLPRARLECSVFRLMRPLGVLRASYYHGRVRREATEAARYDIPGGAPPVSLGGWGERWGLAAQMRIVSAGAFWPSRRGLSRFLKYIVRERIPEFESDMPSQPVWLLRHFAAPGYTTLSRHGEGKSWIC